MIRYQHWSPPSLLVPVGSSFETRECRIEFRGETGCHFQSASPFSRLVVVARASLSFSLLLHSCPVGSPKVEKWPSGCFGRSTVVDRQDHGYRHAQNRGHRPIPIQWLIPTRGTSGSSETVLFVDVSCSPETPDRPPRGQLTVGCLSVSVGAERHHAVPPKRGIEHVPHQYRSSAHFVCGLGGPVGELMRSRRRRHKIPLHQKFSSFWFGSLQYLQWCPSLPPTFDWPATCPGSAPLRHKTSDVSQRAWFSAIHSRYPNLHGDTTHRRRPANSFSWIQPASPIHTKCRCVGLQLINLVEDGWLGLPS